MLKKIITLLTGIAIGTAMASCGAVPDDQVDESFIFVYDMTVDVDEMRTIDVITNLSSLEGISFETDGDGVLVDGDAIYGVKAGTITEVTAYLMHYQATFNVIIPSDTITVQGEWYEPVAIEPIAALEGRQDDFIMGVDLSSIVEVIKRGGKFYNAEGHRQSIYQLLKDAGVNYIRIRLWNDPFTTTGIPYGGGNNDIEVAKQIGRDAKRFGMKILLCLHYSDFWADPGKQVIPKDWVHLETADEVADALYNFTYDAMKAMEEAGAKVDMVQIGNEIAPGVLTQGTHDYDTLNTDNPSRFNLPSAIRGVTSNTAVFIQYLKAGLAAAKTANPNVLTMIHVDRGGNNSFYRTYFDRLVEHDVEFDIIGMSYYIFYHGAMSGFQNNINDIAARYGKPIIVAETSYAFTNQPMANTAHILTNPFYQYPLTPQGQADVTRDIIDIIANVNHDLGIGVFWWEPAWLPVAGAGWAGAGTPGTWANQALFSYQGIRLPSLDIFNRVFPTED